MAQDARDASPRPRRRTGPPDHADGGEPGFCTGFLAAGLLRGLVAADPTGLRAQVLFLPCVVVAGGYGTVTANRRILFARALPGTLALAAR